MSPQVCSTICILDSTKLLRLILCLEGDDDMIENTPEAVVAQPGDTEVSKKRKLFKLKAHSSKVGNLFGASTTSLISGNLDKKASKIHSPPKCEEAKKRPLTPDNT